MAYGLKKIKRGTERIDVFPHNGEIKIVWRKRSIFGKITTQVISI